MGFEKILCPKIFGAKELGFQKSFGTKKNVSKKMLVQKNVGLKIFHRPKKLGPKSLVNIGSVTGEIFLIWTNIARTNVAWTNVTATVGIR